MVDTQLIKKAQEKSEAIKSIDDSWRDYIKQFKENAITFPFEGDFNLMIRNKFIFVEGYCGPLSINRLYHAGVTYAIKTPVTCPVFKIYGVYDYRGSFQKFAALPEIGVHFLGLSSRGWHTICTGDIRYDIPKSFDSLKEVTAKIAEEFQLINMHSLGTILLPDEYEYLRNILNTDFHRGSIRHNKPLKIRQSK